MPTSVSRIVLLLSGLIATSGCGSATPPATVKTVPPTVVVPAQAPAANAGQSQTQTQNASGQPKPRVIEKKSVIPANADPKNIFLVSSDGQPMEIGQGPASQPADQFIIAMADIRSDSSSFVVDSVKEPSQNAQLNGSGQRKAGLILPKGFDEVKENGYGSDGMPMRIVCQKTGTQLALVSGGPAIVGTDEGPEESKPLFSLNLDTFYMEVLEVTIESYEKFQKEQREKKKPVPPAPSNPSAPKQHPVLGVPWGMAVNYARAAGMELPTEAEFEKAARGPHGLRTPWGDGKALWSNRPISAPGSYPTDRSPYGVLDLAGNAMEWCADLYSPTAHSEARSASNIDNWAGPKKAKDMNLRVVKGNGPDWSSWFRQGKDMGKSFSEVGFRCVLRIPPDGKSGDTTRQPQRIIPN